MVLRQQNQPPLGEWHYVQSTLENIKESRLEKVFFKKKKNKKQKTKNKPLSQNTSSGIFGFIEQRQVRTLCE